MKLLAAAVGDALLPDEGASRDESFKPVVGIRCRDAEAICHVHRGERAELVRELERLAQEVRGCEEGETGPGPFDAVVVGEYERGLYGDQVR